MKIKTLIDYIEKAYIRKRSADNGLLSFQRGNERLLRILTSFKRQTWRACLFVACADDCCSVSAYSSVLVILLRTGENATLYDGFGAFLVKRTEGFENV